PDARAAPRRGRERPRAGTAGRRHARWARGSRADTGARRTGRLDRELRADEYFRTWERLGRGATLCRVAEVGTVRGRAVVRRDLVPGRRLAGLRPRAFLDGGGRDLSRGGVLAARLPGRADEVRSADQRA